MIALLISLPFFMALCAYGVNDWFKEVKDVSAWERIIAGSALGLAVWALFSLNIVMALAG